ncbi:MBG domain-containing protein, partial [Myroides odoratus]|uniref:MBG domain-containing protein n=1 Tax=Myroides odoratus TaxID=256 RepID=UPI0039AEE066
GEAIGAYTITQGSLATTTNYTLQYVSDDLTITPAVLTVTANAQAKVYGDADPALTYTISGLKNNEQTVDVLMGALVRVLGEAVNTYLINQGSLTANSNYSVVYTTANFQITPAELIVNAIAKTKLYGDSDTVFNYTVDGLKRNEQKENVLSGRLSRLMGEDVGTYAMNQGSLVTNSNYTIVFHSADLTIIPAELVIIVDPKEKTYGDADPQWTYTFGGLVNNEQIENILTGELIRLPGENAGVYTIKQGTLISNGNYAIRFASADLTIQPAELIVNAEVKTKVYGDVDPTLTYTVSGLKNNEQAADVLAGSLTRDA